MIRSLRAPSPMLHAVFFRSLLLFCVPLLLICPSLLSARSNEEVQSSERLQLLKQATGGSNGTSGTSGKPTNFQNRLNALFDQTADPARDYVAREDQKTQESLEQAQIQEELYAEADSAEDKDKEEGDSEDKPHPFGKRDKTKDAMKDRNQIDASEETYQEELEKDRAEADKESDEEKNGEDKKKAEEEDKQGSEAAPSLANNPFYFSPSKKPERKFEENKNVIISRLLQRGMDETSASTYVGESSSEEELVLKLMQSEDYTYGDALEISQVDSSQEE